MKLMLVRHAEAQHNVDSFRVAGRALESPLTEVGKMQADSLARDLASTKIDVIVHSPALRCLETAKAIKKYQKKSLKLVEDQRVVEMSQGSAVGGNKLLVSLSPVNVYDLITKKLDFSLPQGETFNEVADRMEAAISEYEKDEDKTVVVVTHGLAMRTWLARKNDWNVFRLLTKRIRNTQIIHWS